MIKYIANMTIPAIIIIIIVVALIEKKNVLELFAKRSIGRFANNN